MKRERAQGCLRAAVYSPVCAIITEVKKVVVTGIGAVTPLGKTFEESWDSVCSGISGIRRITRFDASCLPWKSAGEITGFEGEAYFSRKDMNRLDPFVQYAVAASVMAAEDAGIIFKEKAHKEHQNQALSDCGVIIGSSRGGIGTIERAVLGGKLNGNSGLTTQDSRLNKSSLRVSPYLMPSTTVSMAASCVAQKLGIRGECFGISNACASGANAVGEAFRLIRYGLSSLLVAGGSEAPICRLCVEGYGVAGVLSKSTVPPGNVSGSPRPFDRSRDGFVLSEGASVLVLEEYEHALKRNAKIYGEIVAYGNTTDSFHMTQPAPDGEARAMAMALKEAGITPENVDYVNTHGTGTRIGDRAEARAITMTFGKRAVKIPATAIKSVTGHMLAASGAFEIACSLMSMKKGTIPPSINLSDRDQECDINIITEKREADIRIALSNSFGFGGVNAVIILKKM